MTLRQYAESFKQSVGVALGAFELIQTLPSDQQSEKLTELLNAAVDAKMLVGFPASTSTGMIAKFVIAAGPVLELLAPQQAGA